MKPPLWERWNWSIYCLIPSRRRFLLMYNLLEHWPTRGFLRLLIIDPISSFENEPKFPVRTTIEAPNPVQKLFYLHLLFTNATRTKILRKIFKLPPGESSFFLNIDINTFSWGRMKSNNFFVHSTFYIDMDPIYEFTQPWDPKNPDNSLLVLLIGEKIIG